MKNKYLIKVFLLVWVWSCTNQTEVDDSNVTSDAGVVDHWINVSRDSTHMPLGARKKYLEKASNKALAISNDTIRLDKLSRISLAYKRLEDSLRFREMNKRVLDLASKGELYKAEGESHWDLASFLKSYGVMDSAFFHYERAYKSFDRLPIDSTSLSLRGRMLYSMGNIQDYFKDYLGAEVSTTEALRIFEDLEDNWRIHNCNNLLGVIALGMNNHKKSLEYYKRAGEFIEKLSSHDKLAMEWQNKNNIAFVYLENLEYSKAEQAYSELLSSKGLLDKNPTLYAKATTSMAYAIYKGKDDTQSAGDLIDRAIVLNNEIGFSMDQARALQYRAEIYATHGDTVNAVSLAKDALILAKETSNNDQNIEVPRLLTSIDNRNAVAYSNEYYDLTERIKSEERATRDKFARIRLETDEVIQRNEALTRGKLIWTLVAVGLLLAAIALYIIFSQRASNNRLKFEQKQQEANQEIYNLMLSQQGKFEEGKKLEKKRVSEELHDSVLGDLLSIRMFMGVLNNESDEEAVGKRADMIEKLREVEEEIRTISHELSNASYEKFYNFIVSLKELVHTISTSSGIQCSFTYDDDVEWDALEGDIKINAYRIVQESLKNSVKHAQCERATVSFTLAEGILTLTIQDDGVGFDVSKGKNGIGLRNLISRANKINGTLHVDSEPGKGTTVVVKLPAKYIGPQRISDAEEREQILNA